jgi:23S rRNA (cytidine1920-2'-O)/16S rRNA (cytidine1409-2'-O)-methyltransferase
VSSREQAALALEDGRVLVSGALATKASRMVAASEPLVVLGPGPQFASRGGEKLAAALERFSVDVEGKRVVDAGASTGGFVDCLLQRGAATVFAVDVGHGVLDAGLRADPRVRVLEGHDIRAVDLEVIGGPVEVVTADLAFISLRGVAPALVSLGQPGSDLVVLVKPQFEAGRVEASRGRGVIRSPEVWRDVLGSVASAFAGAGTGIMGAMASPIRGRSGNAEFFLHLRRGAGAPDDRSLDRWLDDAVAEAQGEG